MSLLNMHGMFKDVAEKKQERNRGSGEDEKTVLVCRKNSW